MVHDRLDVAMALRCGIHLPEAGLPVDRVRRIVGSRYRVGVSVHSVQAAKRRLPGGRTTCCSATSFPLRPSREFIRRESICFPGWYKPSTSRSWPSEALTPERIPEVMETGCAGVAVLSALMDSREPGQTARQMRICLDQG